MTVKTEYRKAKSLVRQIEKHLDEIKKALDRKTVKFGNYRAETHAFRLADRADELSVVLVNIGELGDPANGR